MKNRAIALLLTAAMLVSFVACGPEKPVDPTPNPVTAGEPANVKELMSPRDEENDAARNVANGANDFALEFSAKLLESSDTENFVCSPYSAWLPLAALLNATDEANRPALLEALGAAGISVEDVNKAASRMLYSLNKMERLEYEPEMHQPLSIVSAVFVDKNETLKVDFAQTFADYYRGETFQVDFSDRSSADAVNAWASENTDGLIDKVIEEFDPETVTAIANAIYFSDRWSWEFNPDETVEDTFHAPDGDTTANFMVRQGDAQTYYEDDKVQMMPLRFETGGTMYIILPKDGDAEGLLKSLDMDYLEEMRSDAVSATGKLLLPQFTIENDVMDLGDTLKAMGVPLLDETTAPLTGGLIQGDKAVWVSSVAQKAMIKVDEKGTTAAAVTVVAMAGSAMPLPTEPFEMVCDKPFVFVLCDSTYDGGDQILFTGVVNNPNS